MTDAALIQQQALLDLIYISQNNRLPYNAMAYSLSELVLSCVYSAQPCVLNTGVSGLFRQL